MLSFSLTKKIKRNYQPKRIEVHKWLKESLVGSYTNVYIDISIVDSDFSRKTNLTYHKKNYPTNVISLEYSTTRLQYSMLIGELILCDEIIFNEALAINKPVLERYAHMIVHGILHLQGFDHKNEVDASKMEQLEIKILNKFKFSNPYIID